MESRVPNLVAATRNGEIVDIPGLKMAVWDGYALRLPEPEELIPLPEGSDIFMLPGRVPLGFQGKKNHLIEVPDDGELGKVQAVSAFLAPAWLRIHHPAYSSAPDAPQLPMFAYSPLGWMDGTFWTCGTRIDPSPRQDPPLFDATRINAAARHEVEEAPQNTFLRQLHLCATKWGCRAAQNYFLHRWELPMPTATDCNADCVGCISESHGSVSCTQERLKVPPRVRDVVEVVLRHFGRVKNPVASFGQGCEGEPLTQAPLLLEVVKGVRAVTAGGTLNLNTNASRPAEVRKLFEAGLSSVRVSMCSVRKEYYQRYHRPRAYQFEDVLDSIRAAKELGGFVSLNYLVFPGFTDREEEVLALEAFIAEMKIDMIQWRNLNIDPQTYLDLQGYVQGENETLGLGMLNVRRRLGERFPALVHGYFNPALDPVTRRPLPD